MRATFLLLLAALAAPLFAQTEIERLQREIAALRENIDLARISRAAAAEEAGLDTRLKEHVFSWTSSDGKFKSHFSVLSQFTYTYHDVRGNGGKGPQADNGRDFHNFRVPYLRLRFEGNFFGPEHAYKFEFAPIGESGTLQFEELWYRWQPFALFNVTFGQMRAAYSFEEMVDRSKRVFATRSAADKAFSQGFAKGINVSGVADLYSTGVLQWNAAVYNGVMSSSNSQGDGSIVNAGGRSGGVRVNNAEDTENLSGGFRNDDSQVLNDSFSNFVDADFMYLARFEFHALGAMARSAADLRTGADAHAWRFMIAISISYFNTRIDGNGSTFLGHDFRGRQPGFTLPPPGSGRHFVRAEIFSATVDGHFRGFGFFVNWTLYYRHVEFHNHGRLQGTNTISPYILAATQDTGMTVEIGYYIAPARTVVAWRTSVVNNDEFGSTGPGGVPVDGDAFGPDTIEYAFNASWCIHGDNLKLIGEYRYAVQQMPHGTGRGKNSFNAVERISDYRNWQEFRLMIQWIF